MSPFFLTLCRVSSAKLQQLKELRMDKERHVVEFPANNAPFLPASLN